MSIALAALVALASWAVVPPAQAATGAAMRLTEFAYGGKVAGAGGGDGEYAELTNVGDAPQDLTGWTYDNSKATAATGLSLSGLGTVAPGESVIVTDLSDAELRTEWGLKASVKVLSNAKTHTLNSGPNSIHLYDSTGAETDSVSYANGFQTAKGQSAWVDATHVGAKTDTTGWTISAVGDHESSWTSASGGVGSPGASTLGTKTPADVRTEGTGGTGGTPEAPCDTEDAGNAPGVVPTDAVAWPGGQSPATIDAECSWVTPLSGQDLSGLAFDPSNAGVLYAVKNKSHVYRLVRSGGAWAKDTANGWSEGKDLRFPDGTGLPDSEGLAVGPDGALYITTERDNAASGTPLDSILKFDPASSATTLVASDQWTLTADLDFTASDANLGFEGVAYVPDSFLVGARFRTDAGSLYDPAAYPGKAVAGLFLGAVEKTGHLRAYVLNTDHTFERVADVDTGMAGVMEASYDADLGRIWAHCDNTCGNATTLLSIGSSGHFAVDRHYRTPTNLPDYNLEGFAVAPASTGSNGTREVLWADDGNRFGHSLWSGTIDLDLGLTPPATPSLTAPTPTLKGLPKVGRTITATAAWGPGKVRRSYTWLANGRVVPGARGSTLRLKAAQVGTRISVRVTGTKPGYTTATGTSRATSKVQRGTLATTRPTVHGVLKVGRKLTATRGAWSAAEAKVAIKYRWYANGKALGGATHKTLRLTGRTEGKRVTVKVTGSAAGYATAVRTSRATTKIR